MRYSLYQLKVLKDWGLRCIKISDIFTNNLYNLYNSEFPLILRLGRGLIPGVFGNERRVGSTGQNSERIHAPMVLPSCSNGFCWRLTRQGDLGGYYNFWKFRKLNMSIAISDIPTFALLFWSGIFPAFLVWPILKPIFSLGSFMYPTKKPGHSSIPTRNCQVPRNQRIRIGDLQWWRYSFRCGPPVTDVENKALLRGFSYTI